ncbi:MAG: hypothetical protein QOD77_635 [Thermoplasmata archaeon]|nr:hypothetical protein [Thermoplasmata archaeon]
MASWMDNESMFRFLHILSGIVWIGMLYFFNLVNLPLLKFPLTRPVAAKMDEKVNLHVVTKTLFWFRWGAAFTLLFGLILLEIERQTFPGGLKGYFLENGMQGHAILMGGLFALVMFFNVWFVIWPRQKKILANNLRLAGTVTDEEKARLAAENAPLVKTATLASRTNTWLSVPMLWGMVMGAHGYPVGNDLRSWLIPILILAAVLLMMAAYANQKPKKA